MEPIDELKLPLLLENDKIHKKEILFLHIMLNRHLPDGDRLPMEGEPEQFDFGPRTKKKVIEFQELHGIDKDKGEKGGFKDGKVGPNTWAKLCEKAHVDLTITTNPIRVLPSPPIIPPLPPLILPRIPNGVPVRPKIFSLQLQIGEQGQFPFEGPATFAHVLQVTGVMLIRKDPTDKGTEFEFQFTKSLALNRGGKPGDSKTDLGFQATLNVTKLPLSFGRFSWSTQVMAAIMRSLNKNAPPQAQVGGGVGVAFTIIKKGEQDILQVSGGGGLYLQATPPDGPNGKWEVVPGATAFVAVTGTIGSF